MTPCSSHQFLARGWWRALTRSSPQVQDTVHGVTTEECQAALQNHGWNIQRAIQYLKVPHAPVPQPQLLREWWHPCHPPDCALSPCRWSSSSAWG